MMGKSSGDLAYVYDVPSSPFCTSQDRDEDSTSSEIGNKVHTTERHLSRKVTIKEKGSERIQTFILSVATLYIDDNGNPLRIEIRPFEGETEGVVYHDVEYVIEVP